MTKEKFTIEDFITRLFITILALFLLFIVLRMFSKEILVDQFHLDNRFTQFIFSDLNNADDLSVKPNSYTLTENELANTNKILVKVIQTTNLYKNKLNFIKQKINLYSNDKIFLRHRMVELANFHNKLISWELSPYNEYNRIISVDGDFLNSVQPHFDVNPTLGGFATLKTFLDENNIPFLYVQVPDKFCKYEDSDQNVDGVITFSNATIDDFIAGFNAMDVDVLELREELHKDGLNHHDLFFKSDHHWKPETGLWVTGLMAKHLNEKYAFNIDETLFSPDNYEYTIYEDAFLGSQGKKISLSRAKPEDFTIIHPRFATDLTLEIPLINLNVTGDFDITYDKSRLGNKNYYKDNPWATYFHGDKPIASITNNNNHDGIRILMIGDSFDNAIVPFLALGVEHIDSIDLRHYIGSLHELISNGDYDIVICVHYISYVTGLYEFLEK